MCKKRKTRICWNEILWRTKKLNKPSYKKVINKLDKYNCDTNIFQETITYIAFPTEEDQLQIIHQWETLLPDMELEEYIISEAIEVIDNNSDPVVSPVDLNSKNEDDSEELEENERFMKSNRNYFTASARSFLSTTKDLEDIHPYPEHMLHYDRALLLKDIISRLKLLKQYDDALGYTSITNTRVYDAIDCDDAEEFKIMKATFDIENDDYGRLPEVEDMMDRDHEAIIAECDRILDKWKQKDKFVMEI